ncbi:MAG: hypothetical protein IJU51_01920 [Clostridia bacterium]|nr:hypothetical protein [Clostridia bacterium]
MDENNDNIKFLSAISYISVLFIVGHFAVEKDNPDLRFHKYQGAVLFAVFHALYLAEGIVLLLLSFVPGLQSIIAFLLTGAISLAYIMMIVMGVSSAVKFEQKQLPFIGFFAVRLRETVDSKRRSN